MSRMTIADLATMMTAMQNDCARIADVCVSLDKRLTALEKSGAKSTKASKPTTQKPKASATTTATATANAPKVHWVLNGRTVHSTADYLSKGARYAFKMQGKEAGGEPLNEVERKALVDKLGDKYVTALKFKDAKTAKAFFTKWMNG